MGKDNSANDEILRAIGALAGRFDKLEDRFDGLEGRFDKLEGRFDKLETRFDKLEIEVFKQGHDIAEIKKNVADLNKKVDHIYSVLDSHMKRIEDILQENAARDRQQERMEQWIFQLADKMNIKLKYQ